MPGEQELLKLIDLPSNIKDIQTMMEELRPLVQLIKEANQLAIGSKNAQGIADYKKNTAELAASLEQVADAQRKLVDLEGKLDTARKKSDPKTRSDEEIRASEKSRAENKARVDSIKAEEDAYKQLALAYNKAAAEAKKLQAVALKSGLDGDKKAAEEAAAAAKVLSDQLKGIDRAVGDNRRNVGNYVDAIEILKKEYQDMKSKMDAMVKAGQQNTQEFQQMNKQLGLLETLSSQASKGFASVTQELKFTEKALQTLRAAGLENTEAFTQMRLEAASAREEFREFAEQQKILASDAPLLTSLTVAAKGLAGAYAIGAGTTALFANGNEKVEKELNKLVAIMTVLQGLQEAHELLQKRGAIAVAFNAAAQKIKNFIMTGSAEAHKAATAAEVLNTEAEVANTIATEENVVAQEAQVGATEAVQVATEGSTRAMIALRFALIASGIGVLLLLLPLVAKGMGLFAKNAKEAAEEALELQEMIEKLNETLARQAELMQGYNEAQREGLQENLALMEKQGKNFYELFAIRKRLAEVDADEAGSLLMRASKQNDIRNAVRRTTDEVAKQHGELSGLLAVQEALENAFITGADKMSESEKKLAKEQIENHQKLIDITQKRYDTNVKLLTDYNNKAASLEQLEVERDKFSEEEKRQLALTTAEIRADAHIRANERIINDERSSQAEIIAAMDASTQQQLAKIAAQRAAVEDQAANKLITPAEAAKQELALDDARQAVIEANNEAKRRKNYEYYIRERNARAEILKLEAQDEAKTNDAIVADQKHTYEQKITAVTAAYNARKKALGVDLLKDLEDIEKDPTKNDAAKNAERLARIAKFDSDIQDLQRDNAKKTLGIVKENQDKILKSWEGFYASQQSIINTHEVLELTALNNAYSNKLISTAAYEKKRTDIQKKAAIERAQIEVQASYLLVNATQAGTAERQKAEEHLSAAVLALTNLVTGEQVAKNKEKEKAIIDSATAVYDTAVTLIDAQYEKEINRIQDAINANQAKYDQEKKDIADSTLSATQKAAEIQAIDAKQAAAQHQLEQQRRMEQQRQAVFDRDAAILKITANTLIGASAAIPPWIGPQAIAIEIAGTAAIASLIAKPIPHYEVGTGNHPGGPMVVHPGELRVDPDGTVSKTPDRGATLTYGDPGTKIIPADEVRAMMLGDIFAGGQNLYVDKSGDIIQGLADLKQEMKRTSQEQVNAYQKQKPTVINVYNDASFQAHITRSV